jgi:hypothetical protein
LSWINFFEIFDLAQGGHSAQRQALLAPQERYDIHDQLHRAYPGHDYDQPILRRPFMKDQLAKEGVAIALPTGN